LIRHSKWLAAGNHLEAWHAIVIHMRFSVLLNNGGGHNFFNLFAMVVASILTLDNDSWLWFTLAAFAATPNATGD
jgi:hypothetical protein